MRAKELVQGIATMLVIVVCLGITSYVETHYTRDAVVTEVTDNTVVVVDTTDNEWEFEGDGFTVGQNVILKMDTNLTDSNIYDDIIVDAKVCDAR